LALLPVAGFAPWCRAEGWVDWRVAGPFVCRADAQLAGLEGLFDDLGRLQQDLVRYLGVPPAETPIELYVFQDERSYRRFLSRYLPDVSYRRALYVRKDRRSMVFAYRGGLLAVDMRHECTHALLHATLPMVPLWLDEGLAEYFEVSPSERAFGSPHLSAVRWRARLGIVPSMQKLEKKGDFTEMGGPQYRDAWAWVHFILHGSTEAHDELVSFLADLRAQTPPGRLSRRLQGRVPDLERRFSGHFRRWKP
jgi:hypothetical protein